ncbi:MAG: TolC family protein [Flavobacteriales bacterium]|nr:TolC family protein [Flavobacteriales bacterium]
MENRTTRYIRILLLFLLVQKVNIVFSQKADSKVLSYKEFIEIVLQNHPLVYQAELVKQSGIEQFRISKGGFDPKIDANANEKYYLGDQYYSNLKGGLKIPGWFGLNAETGYGTNNGVYLNPENKYPDEGLWYAGLSVDLGKGLIIDQRRADYKKGKLVRQATEIERKVIRNQLIYDASLAYWDWAMYYQMTEIYSNAVNIARIRLDGVVGAARFGDRPNIDTVEASIQLQMRKFNLNNARMDYKNSMEKLEMYLWDKGYVPLEINNLFPQSMESIIDGVSDLKEIVNKQKFIDQHPYLTLVNLKIKEQSIDLKLKKEALKPVLNIRYNLINEPNGRNLLSGYSSSNYIWGGNFQYPLFTLKERGALKLGKIKLENQKMEYLQKKATIDYKVNVAINYWQNSIEQYTMFSKTVQYYETLYNAEKKLFDVGESSLFMINSREQYFLDAQLKLTEVAVKMAKAKSEWEFRILNFD